MSCGIPPTPVDYVDLIFKVIACTLLFPLIVTAISENRMIVFHLYLVDRYLWGYHQCQSTMMTLVSFSRSQAALDYFAHSVIVTSISPDRINLFHLYLADRCLGDNTDPI